MKEENVEEKKKKSLNLANKEAAAASVMVGFGDEYISPFAIALGASNMVVGLLTALPNFIAPLFQLYSLKLLKVVNRKKLVMYGVLLHALMWIPILLIPFIFKDIGIYLIVPFIVLYAIFGNFGAPAWVSWMGDLVNKEKSGVYFGNRNRIAGITTLISTFIAAYILDLFNRGFVGFLIIFSIACIFRLISFYLLGRIYEPKLVLEQRYYFSLVQFMKKMKNNNFGRFVIYIALLNLATQIAGPFFAVYMLRDLGFSYKMFMIANVTTAIVSLLSMPLWGKFGDRFGNVRAMKITAVLVAIIPFLWIFSDNFYYIIAIQIVSGFGWAGMNLCHFNFIYDTVTPQRRAICSSYLNILRGFGVLIGAVAGGLIATYVTVDFFKYSLYLVFLLSGILRFLIVPLILDVKEVKRVDGKPLHYIHDIMHNFSFSRMKSLFGMFHITKR